MPSIITIFIISVASIILTALATWGTFRLRLREENAKTTSSFNLEKAVLLEKLAERSNLLDSIKDDLHHQEQRIASLDGQVSELSSSKAVAENSLKLRVEQINQLTSKLEDRGEQIKTARQDISQKEAVLVEHKTRMFEEKKQADEKIALLLEAREELTNQFKTLAQDIFEEKGKKFTEQNHSKMDELLSPFRTQIKEFKDKVDVVYHSEAKERASLKQELKTLCELNQKFNQEAKNLTQALKGGKQAQGAWGEMILERVLEGSGLRKGEEYQSQGSFRDEEGNLFRPDALVLLPEGKHIIVDSKVSLVAYERYCSADDESLQAQALKEHAGAVQNHIKALSAKDYSSLKGINSLDYVLMFMPIEAAYSVVVQYNPNLYAEAFKKKVLVVTPTTLLATLRTVENIWRFERQNQNARIIADKAGAIYDKLRGFIEDMDKVGSRLNSVHTSYDSAMKKLVTGRGSLVSIANKFVDLGVKVKKELPGSVTEMAEIELEETSTDLKVVD